jgi:hypothetical protein
MAVFAGAALARFRKRTVNRVQAFFPAHSAFIGDPQAEAAVDFSIARARRRGYQSHRGMFFYVSLSFLLGSFFDEDPQYPWAADKLAGQTPDREEHIALVFAAASDYLDSIHGPDNEHLVRPLAKVRSARISEFPHFTGGEPPEAVGAFLSEYFPLKAARQQSANAALLMRASAIAQHHDLTGAADIAILLIHSFFLGTGFHHDAQFPWIAELLRSSSSEKGSRLYRRSLDYLNAVAGANNGQ